MIFWNNDIVQYMATQKGLKNNDIVLAIIDDRKNKDTGSKLAKSRTYFFGDTYTHL